MLVHKYPNDSNKQALVAYKKYSNEDYPKYDNYDAIECGRMENLPIDFDGVISVPITGLKYLWSDGTIHVEVDGKQEQFEIVGMGNSRENFTPNKDYINPIKHTKDGKVVNGNAINCVLAIEVESKPQGIVYYTSENSKYLIAPYARILIRRKQ